MDVSPSALFGVAPATPARDAPLAIFVCGCNGAGKSTLIAAARQDAAIAALPLFDPDLLARECALPPLAAGKQAIAQAREALAGSGLGLAESCGRSRVGGFFRSVSCWVIVAVGLYFLWRGIRFW